MAFQILVISIFLVLGVSTKSQLQSPADAPQLLNAIVDWIIPTANAETPQNICQDYNIDGELICFLGQALDSTAFIAELAADQDALTNAASSIQHYLAQNSSIAVDSIDRLHIEKKLKPHMVRQKRLITSLGNGGNSFVQVIYSVDNEQVSRLQQQLSKYIKGLQI